MIGLALLTLFLFGFQYISTKVYSQLPFVSSSPSDSNNATIAPANNQSSTTTTSATTASSSPQQQQLLTYTNPEGRFSIDYPSNSVAKPVADIRLDMLVHTNTNATDAVLSISIENTTKYLDTNTLQVKTHSLRDYVNDKINKINSLSSGFRGTEALKYLKDNPTTVAGNPAWTISYTNDPFLYYTTTYMIKDNKLYTFEYQSGQLKVPETLPVVQKND